MTSRGKHLLDNPLHLSLHDTFSTPLPWNNKSQNSATPPLSKQEYLLANATWARFEIEHLSTASSAMKSSRMRINQSWKLSTSRKLKGCRRGGAHHLTREATMFFSPMSFKSQITIILNMETCYHGDWFCLQLYFTKTRKYRSRLRIIVIILLNA